jgi:hypothetical protein
VVVTQVPKREPVPESAILPDPAVRYPNGSRIVFWPDGRQENEPLVLSGELAAAGAPDVSPDGRSVLFAGRRTADSHWTIFETDIRRPRPRQLVRGSKDCSDPAYLPAGRFVFTCADPETGVWSLHTASRESDGMERITFGPGSAFDPTTLRDGRVLFSMEQWPGADRQEGGSISLFTVNPDGQLLEPFTDSHDGGSFTVRPRQTWDGGVMFLAGDRGSSHHRAERVEMSRPTSTRQSVELNLPGKGGTGETVLLGAAAVEPLPDGGAYLAARVSGGDDSGKGEWSVFRWRHRDGSMERIHDLEEWDEVEVVAAISRPEPRGRPSRIDRDSATGSLVCYDAQRSDGVVGPPRGSAPAVSVSVETASSSPARTSGAATGLRPEDSASLGRAAIESDGSFFIDVPADVPIRVRTLDRDGADIALSGWFWVRPGEVRACFGCHESRESAPVNRMVQAISGDPVPLETANGDPNNGVPPGYPATSRR